MRFPFLRIGAAVSGAVLCTFGPGAVLAAESPSYTELLQLARQSAPRLQVSSAEVAAASGRARQAAAWPNPSLTIEKENFAGNGFYRGSSQAQTTFSVSQPLEVGGQRAARVGVGRAELDYARANRDQALSEFAFDLALTYAAAEVAQERVALLSEDLERAQRDVQQVKALVAAGREGELRAVQAQAAVSGAQAELEAARADASESLARLSSLAGADEPFTSIGPSLLTRPVSGPVAFPESPPNSPAVIAAQANREAAERRLQVERKRVIPALALSVGARRLAGDDATAMVAGVSVSVPLFDRNRGGIAAADAERAAADARLKAARLDLAASWSGARAQVLAASSRLTAAIQREDAASEAYRLARIGYEAGRVPLLELSSTRSSLTEATLRALDARLARVRAEASIARLAGQIPFGE